MMKFILLIIETMIAQPTITQEQKINQVYSSGIHQSYKLGFEKSLKAWNSLQKRRKSAQEK
jgi:hypothetical protein